MRLGTGRSEQVNDVVVEVKERAQGAGIDGAVDEVDRPIQLPLAIREALQGLEETWPDASVLPTTEATRDGVPRAILRRHVTPWSAGGLNPDDAINDASMWEAGSSAAGLLWRKEWSELVPMYFGEFMSAHTPSLRWFVDRP